MAPQLNLDPQVYVSAAILTVTAVLYYYVDYLFYCVVIGCVVYAGAVHFLKLGNVKQIDPAGKAILITGCDAGFGHHLAIRAHNLGFTVFAGCLNDKAEGPRELECLFEERMHVLKMDVTRDYEVQETLQYVKERCRNTGLWALVNNAGINGMGPVEINSLDMYRQVCEVNLFGTIRVTKAFLPLVRQAKGRIINVSSERGLVSRGNNSTYCISKFGLEAFSDSLRHEMKRFGVQVSLTEPGHFGGATAILTEPMLEKFKATLENAYDSLSEDVQTAYPKTLIDEIVHKARAAIQESPSSSEPVIKVMEGQLVNVKVKARYLIGGTKSFIDKRVVLAKLKNVLPEKVFDYIVMKSF